MMKRCALYPFLLFAGIATAVAFAEEWPAALQHTHAHNDYEHPRPLQDALDNGFYSIEADIWLVDEDLLVGHDEGIYKGTLRDLYLDPLQKRVNERGSVHGDGKPVLLWLDLKDGRPALRSALHTLLSQYPMLSRFSEEKTVPKAVTLILTGNAQSKMAYGSDYPIRFACADSNDFSPDDPDASVHWQWYALKWGSYIQWDGVESIPAETLEKLKAIVNAIHAKGRKVRFYATPETPGYWQTALEVGIDLINTDQLKELRQFLQNRSQPGDSGDQPKDME